MKVLRLGQSGTLFSPVWQQLEDLLKQREVWDLRSGRRVDPEIGERDGDLGKPCILVEGGTEALEMSADQVLRHHPLKRGPIDPGNSIGPQRPKRPSCLIQRDLAEAKSDLLSRCGNARVDRALLQRLLQVASEEP